MSWNWTRRRLARALGALTVGATGWGRGATAAAEDGTTTPVRRREPGTERLGEPGAEPLSGRFAPWVEVDPGALRHNVDQVARLTGGSPVLAVVKNDAYGLGLVETARTLEGWSEIAGFAVVSVDEALALRQGGIRKPVLLMGMASADEAAELLAREVSLSLYTDGAGARLDDLRRRGLSGPERPVRAHLYLDTGIGRMGMPYHRALPWLEELAGRADLAVEGSFMTFTEEPEFDPEQLERFRRLVERARSRDLPLGTLHAASSNAVFHLPAAHLGMVRPGIALYGAYPSRPDEERAKARLKPAVRLRARVVRVERLRPGDGVSYGRHYIADRPTWVATLPVGHADGYPREAVDGARVLIGDALYPVIGAVSASHAVVEIGDERRVEVGDVATLVGPDHPAIEPNAVAETTGVSVYDVLMHLNPDLPRVHGRSRQEEAP